MVGGLAILYFSLSICSFWLAARVGWLNTGTLASLTLDLRHEVAAILPKYSFS